MTRAILTAFVLVLALPLAAQQVEDSPLVALAKRTGRLGKHPAHVITNEDLYNYRGRVSWATSDDTTADGTTAPAANTAANTPAAAAKAPRPIDYNAILARQTQGALTRPMPQPPEGSTRASYSAGVSTARDAEVNSSAQNASNIYSTAQNANVRSTANSTQMYQTAPATNLQPVQPHPVN